jgi:hypothetical protein
MVPLAPRRRIVGAFVAAMVVAGGVVVWRSAAQGSAGSCAAPTPVAAKQVARLAAFHDWLRRNRALGLVGEVGWPPGAGWNRVAQAWYRAADRAGLWITAWSAAEGWPARYPLAVYRLAGDVGDVAVSGAQAAVVEQHPSSLTVLRGVAAPSGAFATADDGGARYGNELPGRYGIDYYYPSSRDYRFLAAHKVRIVRVAFAWERIQRRPGGPLDAGELTRLRTTLHDAAAAGISVLLDLHSFGGYWSGGANGPAQRLTLGSSRLPAAALADLWSRLAAALQTRPGLLGYGLMNEPRLLAATPTTGARIWEDASQAAVTAIRATGDRHLVAVEAYAGSGPEQFTRFHPHAWIEDPAGAVRYEVHQYFDSDGSGHYRLTLAAEQRAAGRGTSRGSGAGKTAAAVSPGPCPTAAAGHLDGGSR